jgi:methionyl aminopeptidase
MVIIKRDEEIALMHQAGRIVALVLEKMRELVRPGISTAELDAVAEEIITEHGAIPSFKGYPGRGENDFPASICTSINEEVVHGIPSPTRILREGDIISIDVGAIYKGYHGDAAITLGAGQIDSEVQRLIKVTEGALQVGIDQMRPGKRSGDVSWAMQMYVESRGFLVVREYTGHGIGREMHEEPQVPNFGQRGQGIVLKRGMTIALEPMVNMGTWHTRVLEDGWTVVTADNRPSAHFEHTVVVMDGEPEILTRL